MESKKIIWVPLESNPEVMNKYLEGLGVPTEWQMVDVYGLDSDMLAVIPRPVLALVLLFPINDSYDKFVKELQEEIKEKGQTVSDKVFHIRQKIGNACGTMALLHSVTNNTDSIKLNDGVLKKYVEDCAGLDAEGKGKLLTEAEGIANIHNELALKGQSEAPGAHDPVNHHFISLVHIDGALYELDGTKEFPINHGETSPDTFLEDAAVVCRKHMERDPENVNFTIMALAANN